MSLDDLLKGGGGWTPPTVTAPFNVYASNGQLLFGVDASGKLTSRSVNGPKIEIDPTGIYPVIHFFSVDGTNDAFINVVNNGAGTADLGINSGKYTPADGVPRRARLYMADSFDVATFEVVDEATQNRHGGVFAVTSAGAYYHYQDANVNYFFSADINGLHVNSPIDSGAWINYACVWSTDGVGAQPSIGNGSITSKYHYIDKHTMIVKVEVRTGSTTTRGNGNFGFSLPVAPANGIETGAVFINDANIGTKTATILGATGSVVFPFYDSGTGGAQMSSTNTFTANLAGSYIRFAYIFEV